MNLPDYLGSFAGALTTLAFIPQVVKTWQSKSAHDISIMTISLFCTGLVLWLLYGLSINSWPVIVSNAVTLALAGAILAMKLRFK